MRKMSEDWVPEEEKSPDQVCTVSSLFKICGSLDVSCWELDDVIEDLFRGPYSFVLYLFWMLWVVR